MLHKSPVLWICHGDEKKIIEFSFFLLKCSFQKGHLTLILYYLLDFTFSWVSSPPFFLVQIKPIDNREQDGTEWRLVCGTENYYYF